MDLAGQTIWSVDVGKESSNRQWGSAASLVLYENSVVVNAAEESKAIISLDKATGKELWRQEAGMLELTYGTPRLVQLANGQTELVISVPSEIWAMNPKTGKLSWYAATSMTGNVCPSVILSLGHFPRSFNSSAASQIQSRSSGGPPRGGNPFESLNNDLSKFLSQENVSSDNQQKIKSEFSDALKSMSDLGAQVGPSQVKEALSSVLTANGLDGQGFVSGLGTPPSGNSGAQQSGPHSGRRPPGGGPPLPPPTSTSSSTETSLKTETDHLKELIELLAQSPSESTETSTSQTSQDVLPGNYINRRGGNLDVRA